MIHQHTLVQAQMEDDQETITHTKDLWNGELFIGFQDDSVS